jgi:hypothetical protein
MGAWYVPDELAFGFIFPVTPGVCEFEFAFWYVPEDVDEDLIHLSTYTVSRNLTRGINEIPFDEFDQIFNTSAVSGTSAVNGPSAVILNYDRSAQLIMPYTPPLRTMVPPDRFVKPSDRTIINKRAANLLDHQ